MNPFWNSDEQRLRSLLRIGLQLLLFLLFALGLVFVMSDLLMPLLPEDSPLVQIRIRNNFLFGELTSPLIALGATLLSMFLAGRYPGSPSFPGFRFSPGQGWWQDFFIGLGIGALADGIDIPGGNEPGVGADHRVSHPRERQSFLAGCRGGSGHIHLRWYI